jgi:hypothetical protein
MNKTIECIECMIKSDGSSHKMGCSSKELMKAYSLVLKNIYKFPQEHLDQLSFQCSIESVDRKFSWMKEE